MFVSSSIINKISRFEEGNKTINNDEKQLGSNSFCIFEPNTNQEEEEGKTKSQIFQVFPSYENLDHFRDSYTNSSKYEFSSGTHISAFFDQPEILNMTVHQGFLSFDNYTSPCNKPIFENLVVADDGFERQPARNSIAEKSELVADVVLHQGSVTEKLLEKNEQQKNEADLVVEPIWDSFFDNGLDLNRQQWETTTEREYSDDVDLQQDLENTEGKKNSVDVHIELEPQSQKFPPSDENVSFTVDSSQVQDTKVENLVHDEPSFEEKQSKSKFSEDSDSEPMLEHDDIIEQLKMEIKIAKANARKGGLPTISEDLESDYSKSLRELKPMMIDQKIDHKDRIAEIHKIYKSYADKMRKLDVLNMQTLHAFGFAQQKPSMHLTSTRKSAVRSRLWKQRRPKAVQPMDCTAGLKTDFEMVYVGQLCLSWEILHWQYQKALEFREYDSHRTLHYNQVAGEFQLLQVLMQRFLENEPFQGQPRIENYVASRSVLRSLLQVPVVIDDASRDKKLENECEEYFISTSNLTNMIGETLQLFWQFLSADNVVVNCSHRTSANIENPADFALLLEIQDTLQKKEKKLKEIARRGLCIVKGFKKHEEEEDRLMLFAQRLTYRARHSYATKSNQHRVVKTPGGKLVYQTTKKRASGPKCPVTGKRIQGIPHLRPTEYKRSRLSRNRRTVNRPYGGVLSGGAVRERIIRAFLVEEQKIVKKVLKLQKTKEKATKS
ncbi:hypothetical protein ACFE04_024969 [Oxalis oulophora]